VLDKQGRVHLYPLPLSLHRTNGQAAHKTLVEALDGRGRTVADRLGSRRRVSAGQALLALMDNTVAVMVQ